MSGGIRLSKRLPLTITAIVPYSWISERGQARRSGTEDIVLGVRYRYDLKGLQEKWDREGNFLMGMGAFELNNGTIDHRAWSGPLDPMGAVLGSLERGKWSAIGYTVVRFKFEDSDGNNEYTRVGWQEFITASIRVWQALDPIARVMLERPARLVEDCGR